MAKIEPELKFMSTEQRDKYWDELDDVGKIERMKSIVKSMQEDQNRLRDVLQRFEQHSHDVNGHAVVPYSSFYYPHASEIGYGDNKWF